jgi:hypothetical protein
MVYMYSILCMKQNLYLKSMWLYIWLPQYFPFKGLLEL